MKVHCFRQPSTLFVNTYLQIIPAPFCEPVAEMEYILVSVSSEKQNTVT